jgi:hypothetical protein
VSDGVGKRGEQQVKRVGEYDGGSNGRHSVSKEMCV